MRPGDHVAWNYHGILRQGTLRRLGTHLAHVQIGESVVPVAMSDCRLTLVAPGAVELPPYRPELAYGIGEAEPSELVPGNGFRKPSATKEPKQPKEKTRKPDKSEQSQRTCVDCGWVFVGRVTQTRCTGCNAAKRKADGRAYYHGKGKLKRKGRKNG